MILPHPVAPNVRESLVGFVMRAAELNGLHTYEVLRAAVGRYSFPPEWSEAEQLAALCRCSMAEITQLFGFRVRRTDGVWAWQLGDEWITKAQFVSSRTMAVCPECLRQDTYLPGTWELSLYRACAFHKTRLLFRCPACGRALRWTRPRLWGCPCGFDYRHARTETADWPLWITAQLIEHRLEPAFRMECGPDLPASLQARLGELTIDGLCRTLWALGHFVAGVDVRADGFKHRKRREDFADAILSTAFAILARWPEALQQSVDSLMRRSDPRGGKNLYVRVFKPLLAYLEDGCGDTELQFLRATYEQCLRQSCRIRGRRIPKGLGPQMEIEFRA